MANVKKKQTREESWYRLKDILIIRKADGTLGHTIHRKATHTDRYLNGESHHHPSQLLSVGKCLFQRAQRLCDDAHLEEELQHAKQVLHRNKLRIPRLHHKNKNKTQTVPRQPAYLPYVKGVTDRISRILKRASIHTIFKPHKKIQQFLRPIKSNTPLQDAGIYKLDCDCGLSYIGQTKRNMSSRLKEHIADIKPHLHLSDVLCCDASERYQFHTFNMEAFTFIQCGVLRRLLMCRVTGDPGPRQKG
ncbi:unnamed protein product [Pieris macdunnoughi]|uniref:Helix-turn-helix domain-containing protein n=1 Tax=Pieris macdunnoughi TaxID=345717 RepID=A0A821XP88_9NEOP|nr:unnamed protein product [Pieris macdunnoughi]